MNSQEQKRIETHCWEFTLPVTVTMLAHHELDYPEALRKLKDISKEDVYKAFLNAINNRDFKSVYPAWYGGEHLKEGAYLRELSYDEKYRGKQPPEIPVPISFENKNK